MKNRMKIAIDLAMKNVVKNLGGPFGAVIVKTDTNEIISKGFNRVTSTNDPTAHAEIVAIRKACKKLKTFDLSGYTLYTSCEPCPMCFSAIYWSHLDKVFYACTKEDAANINFDDNFIYEEISKPINERKIEFIQIDRLNSLPVFNKWIESTNKIEY